MLDETSLHEKLSTLQAHLLKFHEEISPKKQETDRTQLLEDEESDRVSICITVLFYFLKACVWLIGPALFPAIVYCIEGTSDLFWQVTAISCVLTLLLIMMIITFICLSTKKVLHRIQEIVNDIRNNLYNIRFLRYIWDVLTSDFMKMNIHKILYPVMLMCFTGVVAIVAYTSKIWIGFYATLVTIGFIIGILSTILCDFVTNPELLPFYSPCKIKMVLSTPSPKAKRQLILQPDDTRHSVTPVSRFSSETRVTPKFENSYASAQDSYTSAQDSYTSAKDVTSLLPNYSSSINHAKKENVSSNFYQLPINISNFFRSLQS